MQFRDIIGQGQVKEHLVDMVSQNRLSHALLFLGKEGSGGLAMAMAFAQYLVCEKVNKPQVATQGPSLFGFDEPEIRDQEMTFRDSCGECAACQKARSLMHPDIHFSYPVFPRKSGDKPVATDFIKEWREFALQAPYSNVYEWLLSINAENRQGNITAEECNDINRKLSLKSFESEHKILVMWMPEYLGNAGNKLLKLIEEPPANTVFLLVAENEEKILPTILSRTQLVKIPLLQDEEVEQALIERNGIDPDQAKLIAGMAQGNYHEALQLTRHSDEDWLSLLKQWMNATIKEGPAAQTKWVEEMARQGREKQKQFIRYFNHLLEQCIRARIVGEDNLALTPDEKEMALKLNKVAGVSQQQAIIEELDKASYYIERNANAKMLFQALTIRIYHMIQNKVLLRIM